VPSSCRRAAVPIVRHVPANPSSYAYPYARRWEGLDGADPRRLKVPDLTTRASCPNYDTWHFGLSGSLPPYALKVAGGVRGALTRFARRHVVYLQGYNDTCACNPSDKGCGCISHGLEVTCADELMGRFRLERGRLYFAALQAFYNRTAAAPVHAMVEVPNVGHDHTLMWQGGLRQLFSAG